MSIARFTLFFAKRELTEEITEWKSEDVVSLNYLNDLCLLEVFGRLSFKKRIQLIRVCKRWRSIMPLAFINDQKLPLKSIAGTFEWIIIFGPNRFKCGSHIFRSVLKMFPDIFNSVIFPHTWPAVKLSLSDIRLLVSNCAKLKTLNLTYTTLPNRGILELMGNLDQLEALWLPKYKISNGRLIAIAEGHWKRVMAWMPKLKFLKMDGSLFTGNCLGGLEDVKSLRWVSFGNMPRLLDEHLIEFLKCHPDLREFRMRNGGSPPACLAKYCRKLSILQLDWTHPSPPGLKFNRRFFTSVFPELKRLRRLYVAFNKYFDDSALRSVCNSCPQLEVLLMGSTKVSAGQLLSLSQLTSLKTLDISHIDDHQNVTDTVLMAVAEALGDNLEHLWITDYNNITDMSLIHLARFCPNLEKLVVDHCSKITTDGLVSYLSSMVRHPSWESQRQRILSVSAKGSKIELQRFPLNLNHGMVESIFTDPADQIICIKKQIN